MASPLISIVVPVFNTSHYLESCVCSITAQPFDDYELILVDDGSTDDSGIMCDAAASNNPRIHVIHQGNSGVSAARNAGMDVARGEYLWFCDSDDRVVAGALPKIANALKTKEPDVLAFEIEQVNDVGDSLGCIPAPRPSLSCADGPLQCDDPLYPHAHVFRRKLADGLHFDTSLALLEDRDFFYRLCLRAAGHTEVIKEPLYRYLITREDSAVNSSSITRYFDAVRVQESILESELTRGFSSPAYEIFATHALGVLSRAYRCNASDKEIDDIRQKLHRYWDLRDALPGKQRLKCALAIHIPAVYRILALLVRRNVVGKPGETVIQKGE